MGQTLPISNKEVEDICRKVAKLSVKTGHPNFHNQLFSGICPSSLAASWVADALNTSNILCISRKMTFSILINLSCTC